MKKPISTAIGAGLAGMVIYSAIAGNTLLLPVSLPLLLAYTSHQLAQIKNNCTTAESVSGKSARITLTVFAILSASLALFTPLYFPAMADTFGWTQYFDGDFVRVTINDMQETGYITSAVLLLNIALTFFISLRSKTAGVSTQR